MNQEGWKVDCKDRPDSRLKALAAPDGKHHNFSALIRFQRKQAYVDLERI
jgi:hypothetical protein